MYMGVSQAVIQKQLPTAARAILAPKLNPRVALCLSQFVAIHRKAVELLFTWTFDARLLPRPVARAAEEPREQHARASKSLGFA